MKEGDLMKSTIKCRLIFFRLISCCVVISLCIACLGSSDTYAVEKKSKKTEKSFNEPAAKKTESAPITESSTESTPRTSSEDTKKGYGKTHGIAGPVTFGPYFALSLPHPLNFGIEGKFKDMAGLSINYGFMPERTFSNVKAKWNHLSIRARYFIFHRSLFAGLGFGRQNVYGEQTKTIAVNSVDYSVNAKVKITGTTFFPHVGWRWQWRSGFTLGVEVGAQFAAGTSTTFETNISDATVLASSAYLDVKKKVEDTGNDYGDRTLPYLTLIQVGYMF